MSIEGDQDTEIKYETSYNLIKHDVVQAFQNCLLKAKQNTNLFQFSMFLFFNYIMT